MWVLNFLPNWIFHALLIVGILGYVATFLIRFLPPFVYIYKLPIQLVSIGVMTISLYMLGAIAEREAWEARVKEMEDKIKISEQMSKEQNVEIVTKIVTKTKLVREKAKERISYIDREVVKYDSKCDIPYDFIQILNEAAEPPK